LGTVVSRMDPNPPVLLLPGQGLACVLGCLRCWIFKGISIEIFFLFDGRRPRPYYTGRDQKVMRIFFNWISGGSTRPFAIAKRDPFLWRSPRLNDRRGNLRFKKAFFSVAVISLEGISQIGPGTSKGALKEEIRY